MSETNLTLKEIAEIEDIVQQYPYHDGFNVQRVAWAFHRVLQDMGRVSNCEEDGIAEDASTRRALWLLELATLITHTPGSGKIDAVFLTGYLGTWEELYEGIRDFILITGWTVATYNIWETASMDESVIHANTAIATAEYTHAAFSECLNNWNDQYAALVSKFNLKIVTAILNGTASAEDYRAHLQHTNAELFRRYFPTQFSNN